MPKGYLIVFYRETPSEESLMAYGPPGKAAMEAGGGHIIARGDPAHTYESGLKERVGLVEFESPEAARAAYESGAYQEALSHLSVVRDVRVMNGT